MGIFSRVLTGNFTAHFTVKIFNPHCCIATMIATAVYRLSYKILHFAIEKKICVRKANLMLHTFSSADPLVKSCLLKFYCLSLYGCSLWNLSCHSLCSIEVSFNNILRRIWKLPRNCHTGILHLTALLPSIFNVVQSRSSTLLSRALSS